MSDRQNMVTNRARTMRLLFIGNSFTARNDLPGMIAKLASAHGVAVEHRLLSIGGASLRTHWNKGEAQRAIKSGDYDYVILQEQSTLPVKNAARMQENVTLFAEAIGETKSELLLYMTWARTNAPESQQAISDAYRSAAQRVHATLVPVGDVWALCLRTHRDLVLHDRDGSHPSIVGTYLAACVFLRVLLGLKAPENIIPEGLDQSQAAIIQRMVKSYRPKTNRRR